MKFILLSGRWYGGGGTETVYRDFSNYLINNGHEVIILADRLESDMYDDENLCDGKLKIRYLPRIKHDKSICYFLKKGLNITHKTISICKEENVDYVFCGDKDCLFIWFAKLFCKFKHVLYTGGITAIVLNKELDFRKKNNFFKRFLINLNQRVSYILPNKIISISDYEKKLIGKYTNRKDIKVIYHGINTDIYNLPIDVFNKHKDIVIGYFGRFAHIKYPELFFEILGELQKIHRFNILWIGNVEDYTPNDIKNMIKLYSIHNFKLVPFKEGTALIKEISKLDIFFSTEQHFAIGRSTLEAASCGLPIVALNYAKLNFGFFTQNKEDAIARLDFLIKSKTERLKEGKLNRKYIITNVEMNSQFSKILKYIES